MSKSLALVLAIIILALGAGVAAFVYTGRDEKDTAAELSSAATDGQTPAVSIDTEPEVSAGVANDQHLKGANIGETVDAFAQSEVTVGIDDFVFKTTTLKIKKGTVVTWVNQGSTQHDVTSTTNSPKQGLSSEMLGKGEKYSFTFNEAGTYQYFCSPHPTQMRGVVEVAE